MACYHKNIRRFTAKVRPERCDVAGHEGKGRKFVSFPIHQLVWREWGEGRSEGFHSVNVRTGNRVGMVLYRRSRCADGRFFYSMANVVNVYTGIWTEVRLPTCDDPGLIG